MSRSYLKSPVNLQILKSNFIINDFVSVKNNEIVNIYFIYCIDTQQICGRQIDKVFFTRNVDGIFIIN